jgi:RNA polymerase sigma-70 factor (ECF subfamily)
MDARRDAGPRQEPEELITQARAGDEQALEQIFNTYRNQVFALAYRVTGNPSDAEDVCQEVFLQVMRKIGSFEGRASFSTWLYRITMNRSRDLLRRKKRTPEMLNLEGSPDALETDEAGALGPEAHAVASDAQSLVQGALMRLPYSLRAPLVLHEIEGLEYREVARLLRLPVGTVKSRIFRGRLKLAELLEPHKEQWR